MYRGVWNDTIPVAVKFVLTNSGDNGDNFRQLAKEIAILRECRNSNIVQFYGACLRAPAPPGQPSPHALMLITEFMPLGDLFAALQGSNGPEYRWQNKYERAECCCFSLFVDVLRHVFVLNRRYLTCIPLTCIPLTCIPLL